MWGSGVLGVKMEIGDVLHDGIVPYKIAQKMSFSLSHLFITITIYARTTQYNCKKIGTAAADIVLGGEPDEIVTELPHVSDSLPNANRAEEQIILDAKQWLDRGGTPPSKRIDVYEELAAAALPTPTPALPARGQIRQERLAPRLVPARAA